MTESEITIEVVVYPSGTRAEATSPENARLAARTLLREEQENQPGVRGKDCSVQFFVEGQLVTERGFV